MKKILAMLLSLVLLLSCAAAEPAEEKAELGRLNVFGDFTVRAALPEGYRLAVQSDPGVENMAIFADLIPDDPSKPAFGLVIAFSDAWSEYERLNDIPEDELKIIEESFTAEADDIVISYAETAYGTKLLTARDPDGCFLGSVYTIYKGYEIELYLVPPQGGEITEEQFDNCVKFLSDMDFDLTVGTGEE